MPLKEPAYAFQQPVIFLPADLAAARGAALAQVVHEAGALIAGDGLMDILLQCLTGNISRMAVSASFRLRLER